MNNRVQLDLFAQVTALYAGAPNGTMTNEALYDRLAQRLGVPSDVVVAKTPVGRSGQKHSLWKRRVRFAQLSLRHWGILEKKGNEKGVWSLTAEAGRGLDRPGCGVSLVAFSTKLGMCIWGSNLDVIQGLDEPIHLYVSSPPFPLAKQRAYHNVPAKEWVEWIVRSIEPVAKRLASGGSICIQVSPDIFETGSPARSLYREKMVIAFKEELSLDLLDTVIWANPSKPPAPVQWASKARIQLNVGYEVVYVFTNNALCSFADNRRVLQPHSDRHKALMAAGGERRTTSYGDGAYRLRDGSYGQVTEGKIPRNVLTLGHSCADTRAARRHALELGLPAHGAMMPTALPDFLIRWLSRPGDLVLDSFSGSGKTGLAAERNGRRWLLMEQILQYARVSAEAFRPFPEFFLNPLLGSVGNRV